MCIKQRDKSRGITLQDPAKGESPTLSILENKYKKLPTRKGPLSSIRKLGLNPYYMEDNAMRWALMDQIHSYSYREDRKAMAQKLGYEYISECTVDLYYKLRSTKAVAEILGLSTTGIIYELKNLGVKLLGRGGPRKNGKNRT